MRMVYIELASPTKNQFQLTASIHAYTGSSIGRKKTKSKKIEWVKALSLYLSIQSQHDAKIETSRNGITLGKRKGKGKKKSRNKDSDTR